MFFQGSGLKLHDTIFIAKTLGTLTLIRLYGTLEFIIGDNKKGVGMFLV